MISFLASLFWGEGGVILQTTLQASVLILVLLLIQGLVKHRLPPRWHAALWLLVILRLAVPWAPESSLSAFNLPTWLGWDPTQPMADENFFARAMQTLAEMNAAWVALAQVGPASGLRPLSLAKVLVLLYTLGVLIIGGTFFRSSFRLWRTIRVLPPMTQPRILDLLEKCKTEMGVFTLLAVVETEHVKSPALFGWLRPRLLLPKGLVDQLDAGELRHVFLHELGHLRRGDIYLGWLMALLLAVHWFNPLVWLAFARLRQDRELACDEAALQRVGENGARAYGATLLRLLEMGRQRPVFAGLAGILGGASSIKQRLLLAAGYVPKPFHWTFSTLPLLVVLGLLFLTNGEGSRAKPEIVVAEVPGISTQKVLGDPASRETGTEPEADLNTPLDAGSSSSVLNLSKLPVLGTDWFPRGLELARRAQSRCGESHGLPLRDSRAAWRGSFLKVSTRR